MSADQDARNRPPPTVEAASPADLEDWVRLSLVPGVGPKTRQNLLAALGSPQRIFAAKAAELREVEGVGSKLSREILRAVDQIDVQACLARCRDNAIDVITDQQTRYPQALRAMADPPGILFVRGEIRESDLLSIAVVGTRFASQYGLKQAERLASGLSRAGFCIVSGLARGIDAVAHRATLANNGRTIAVLGSGLLELYPPEHKQLAEKIAASGALLSELPPSSPPRSGSFPQRNRLISGLSLGVVVVEAPHRSGAIITATHAAEQGREVFAVPGRVDQPGARGCHQLIRDGARLVETVEDVIEELGPLMVPASTPRGRVHHPAEVNLNDQERAVLAAIDESGTDVDLVAIRSRVPIHRVLATLIVLERKQLIQRVSGRLVARR